MRSYISSIDWYDFQENGKEVCAAGELVADVGGELGASRQTEGGGGAQTVVGTGPLRRSLDSSPLTPSKKYNLGRTV